MSDRTVCTRCGRVIAHEATSTERLRASGARCKGDKNGSHYWVMAEGPLYVEIPKWDELRATFLRLLTVDSATNDRRRKEYNQAVFIPDDGEFGGGHAVWTETTLDDVMQKFDRALKEVKS